MITFERKHIAWGNTPNEPLEVVVRIYLPTDHAGVNRHIELIQIEARFKAAGYDTEIGYSDSVVCISRL